MNFPVHIKRMSLRRLIWLVALSTVILSATAANAQWTSEWTSLSVSTSAVSGWVSFQQAGGQWDERYFTLDSMNFVIMTDAYSQTPAYTYSFTNAERFAGNYLYSLGLDLTGDGITEFYVLGAYGTSTAYRQSFKVFDITTGTVVFERNAPAYDFSYPTFWDVDGDGVYECTFSRADYPSEANYVNEVYNTSVPVSRAGNGGALPRQIRLGQNYPNPFNPSTQIDFDLEHPGVVELGVYNLLGQKVNTLVNGLHSAGHHSVVWDGRVDGGASAPSGEYFYRLKLDDQPRETRRMILLR
jgi:hypothetical protein